MDGDVIELQPDADATTTLRMYQEGAWAVASPAPSW